MRLKVGDLSKRTGLSVRTLHHYVSLGLLKPSVRSDVGYRLYDAEDVRRLNKIVGLRELGIPLDEIRQILEGGMLSTPAVLSAQLARVDAEILRQKKLRLELERLQRALAEDGEPSEAACLHTLEAMAIYRRHLSDDDRNLPLLGSNGRFAAAWQVRLDVLRALFEKGVSARAITARQAARNWILQLEKDTRSNAGMFVRVDSLLTAQGRNLANTGFSPELAEYILCAFCEHRLSFYRKHLAPAAYKHLRGSYIGVMREWPGLLHRLEMLLNARCAVTNADVQSAAKLWIGMRGKLALDEAASRAMRYAESSEEELRVGTWLHPRLLTFLKKAVASVSDDRNYRTPGK